MTMAKALHNTPPTSSVQRLFDKGAVARALGPPTLPSTLQGRDGMELAPSTPKRDSIVVKREFVLTPTADETLTRLVQVYREATGTRLSSSHVIRAILRGIAVGLPAIKGEVTRHGPLKLPSNARGYEAERDRFEQAIASSFLAAMRSLPSYETVLNATTATGVREFKPVLE